MTGCRVSIWSTESSVDGARLAVEGWAHPDEATAPDGSVLVHIGGRSARMDTDQARRIAAEITVAAARAEHFGAQCSSH